MDLKFSMIIFLSSCYTRKELQDPPISCVGGAIALVDHVQKLPFYASLWRLTSRDRRLAVACNVGSVKYKA